MEQPLRHLPPHIQLLQACQMGDLLAVQRLLLLEHVDLNAVTDGHSPLREASRNGHYQIVRLLLAASEHGGGGSSSSSSTVENSLGATPLHLASCRGHTQIVSALLNTTTTTVVEESSSSNQLIHQTSWDGWTALHWASAYGAVQVVHLLLEQGADATVRDRLSGFTALHTACKWGHLAVVKELYSVEAYLPDDDGCTPLHIAAAAGWFSIVRFLVEEGVDVKACSDRGQTARDVGKDHEDICALFQGSLDIHKNEEVMVPTCVERRHLDSGTWPLHEASRRGHLDAVDFWVSMGADINAVRDGSTPLHEASSHDQLEVVAWFLEQGADTAIRNEQGQTASEVARTYGHDRISELLDEQTVQGEDEHEDFSEDDEDIPFTVLKKSDDDDSFLEDIPLPVLEKSANIASGPYLFQDTWVGPLCDSSDDEEEPRYHQEQEGKWGRLEPLMKAWDPRGNKKGVGCNSLLPTQPPLRAKNDDGWGAFCRPSSGLQRQTLLEDEDIPLPLPAMKSCRSGGSDISCVSATSRVSSTSIDSRDAEGCREDRPGDRIMITGNVPQRKYKPMSLLS